MFQATTLCGYSNIVWYENSASKDIPVQIWGEALAGYSSGELMRIIILSRGVRFVHLLLMGNTRPINSL